jgi:Cation/multidrug efflux pump
MTSLVMCGILFFGIISYRALPVNDLPAVDFPTIQVTAGLTGANAETMASTVATPLEKQFATIAGLSSMTSTSSQGSTTITLQFSLDPEHRLGRSGRELRHLRRHGSPSPEHDDQADIQEGEPGG